jgi:hypothetical protein
MPLAAAFEIMGGVWVEATFLDSGRSLLWEPEGSDGDGRILWFEPY